MYEVFSYGIRTKMDPLMVSNQCNALTPVTADEIFVLKTLPISWIITCVVGAFTYIQDIHMTHRPDQQFCCYSYVKYSLPDTSIADNATLAFVFIVTI